MISKIGTALAKFDSQKFTSNSNCNTKTIWSKYGEQQQQVQWNK